MKEPIEPPFQTLKDIEELNSWVPGKPRPSQPLDYAKAIPKRAVFKPRSQNHDQYVQSLGRVKRTTGLTGRTYLDVWEPRISGTALALIVVILGTLSLPIMDHVVGLYPHRVFSQVVTDLTFYVLTFICCIFLMRE